jgi:hypothetical protein
METLHDFATARLERRGDGNRLGRRRAAAAASARAILEEVAAALSKERTIGVGVTHRICVQAQRKPH